MISNLSQTYSRKVKDELVDTPVRDKHCWRIELAATLVGAARFRGNSITLTTAHLGFAELLSRILLTHYHVQPGLQVGRDTITLNIEDKEIVQKIVQDLDAEMGFDPIRGSMDTSAQLPSCCRQAALRAFFLACGSISDPSHAYHLEFSIRRQDVAAWLMKLLIDLEIPAHCLHRQGYSVVYIKDGQYISDFLLLSGAHQSLLAFESLRVEKEMRNSVNRVVNCDSANSQRIANASARQLELLHAMQDGGLLSSLPEELVKAAEARLDNPDLSLKELGETMIPPLGKSGMNHRLKKLEKIAMEYLEKKAGH
jgi:DNA-binding protein WhiA